MDETKQKKLTTKQILTKKYEKEIGELKVVKLPDGVFVHADFLNWVIDTIIDGYFIENLHRMLSHLQWDEAMAKIHDVNDGDTDFPAVDTKAEESNEFPGFE